MPYTMTNSITTATNEWTSAMDRQIWTTWTTGTSGSTSRTIVVPVHITSGLSDAVVWATWNQSLVHATAAVTHHLYQQTEENLAAAREARIRIAGEKAAAREKAELILRECLNPKQKEELALHGHFHLETIAQSGERRRYRIERGRSQNVKQVTPEGRIIKTLCMHPVMTVPDADTMLAQKLYLEGAEEEFLSIANHS